MLGGVGVSGGIAVGSLLAEDLLGSPDLAGLANTFQILGSALLVVPGARLMARRGRRVGLSTGYAVAALGALLAVVAASVRSFPLLLLATFLFGAATATNNQSRYAAVDLATTAHRGRDLSTVVWATTVGAVLGPNLLGPTAPVATRLGLPPVAGVWLVCLVALATCGLWVLWRLRPDPLLLAREIAGAPSDSASAGPAAGGLRRALHVIATDAAARAGVATVAIGHTVMVSVMVMTPLHVRHGGADLELVGVVISVHVLGMYAFSPVLGRLVDRFDARRVGLGGAAVLLLACALCAQAPTGWTWGLTAGLFLLGLGWSATLVAGSTGLTAAVPTHERPGVQGASDLVMGICGAAGGALSGVVVQWWGYGALAVAGGALAVVLAAALARPARPTALS